MSDRNLIQFDWAIRRLLRDKADFAVLEGFLSELLKEDVVIESVLESESRHHQDHSETNRVGLLVKNSSNEQVIVEIQNQIEHDHFHQMAHGTSNTIKDYISYGDEYKNIEKVYSVNIVNFDLGSGEDYIYHGKTEFIGIHNADNLLLSASHAELISGKIEPYQVFLEYFVIKLDQFNNQINDTLDEWVYYLKNNEIQPDFSAKGMDKARKHWRVDKLSEKEQKKYFLHLEDLNEWNGESENVNQDPEWVDEKKQIAFSLKKNGVAVDVISNSTGLSQEEILQL